MAELDKQQQDTQEYYGNYPNFRVASGIKIPDGDLKGEYVDWSVTTDNLQGIAWYKNGTQKLVVNNCSYEFVGEDSTEEEMSKIILAKNGNIKIECKNGDIELRARNITLDAEEEVKILGDKIFHNCTIMNLKSTNCNVLTRQNLTMAGQFTDVLGASSVNLDTMDTAPRARYAGKILTVLNNRIKEFFEDMA